MFKGDLRAPILGTWKIRDFIAIKKTLGKENVFFLIRGENSERKVTRGYLLIAFFFKHRIEGRKSCGKTYYRTLRTDGLINRRNNKEQRTRNWFL